MFKTKSLLALSTFLCSFAGFAGAAVFGADTPNVVIFLTDDQGWGDLECQGHPTIKSPNLDRFATQGVRFTQCYSACGVCSPSRSAILTGRTPYRNGVWRWIPAGHEVHLRTSEITIAELLKERGYETCHVGKWHLNGHFNSPKHPQPGDHGFDHWMATQNNAAPSHKNPRNFVRNGEPVGELEGFSAPLVADEAIRWLEETRDGAKPFFLNLWTHEPHLPIESAPEFMKHYDSPDEGIRQHHGNITQLDFAFGRIMDALDRLGLAENTMVFYTSDNGPEGNGTRGRTRGSTGGLRGRKRADYEGGIRVPGMFRWPAYFKKHGIKPGTVSEIPVIGHDIFATICEVVGMPLPADRTIDGASLLPALRNERMARKEPLYWRTHISPRDCRVALRVGDWKIVGDDTMTQFQLFNMASDWKETRDLSGAEFGRFLELKHRLIAHDAAVKSEGPDWWKEELQPRRQRRGAGNRARRLPRGDDKTGEFQIVRGGVVTRSELGYALESSGEGVALKKTDAPLTGRVVFSFRYRSLSTQTTKNAMLVFGDRPRNETLIKVGTAIGMGAHAIFEGEWGSLGTGAKLNVPFDKSKLFDAVVTVDLDQQTVEATIDGARLTTKLPRELRRITHYGYYVKGTRSEFTPIAVGE